MGREQEPSGDYGYDLAHEATGRRPAAVDGPGGAQHEHGPVDGQAGQGEDLGYDEAHDF